MTHDRAQELPEGTVVYAIDRWATRGVEAFVLDKTGPHARGQAWYASRGIDFPGFRVMGSQTPEDDNDHGRMVPLGDSFTCWEEAATEARRRIDAAIAGLVEARERTQTAPVPYRHMLEALGLG